MRPRPIYRWKCFWFGLLTLAFMGWATVDSRHYWTTLNIPPWHLERAYQVSFFVHRDPSSGTKRAPIEREAKPESGNEGPELPSLVRMAGLRLTMFILPDAAVFFPFLLAWVVFLGWRWRRQNKAEEMS